MGKATTFTGLLNLLLPDVPGCPNVLAIQHLQQAARKFCEKTEAWRETLPAIDLVAEDVTYTLTPSYDCEIRRILEVWIRSEEDVDDGLDGTLQAYDKYEYEPEGSVLTLDDTIEPQEAVTDGLVVKVVLVPYLVTDVDSDAVQGGISPTFLNYWAEPILAYAKYSLMLMPKKTWSNPQLATVFLNDYNTGVSRALTEVDGLKYRHEQDAFGA
jgi:hypothetical protein